jgi:hypothetical protein
MAIEDGSRRNRPAHELRAQKVEWSKNTKFVEHVLGHVCQVFPKFGLHFGSCRRQSFVKQSQPTVTTVNHHRILAIAAASRLNRIQNGARIPRDSAAYDSPAELISRRSY